MFEFFKFSLLFLVFSTFLSINSFADEVNEFVIKREKNFTFKIKPIIEKHEDGFNIIFETNSFCDVTIVIEDSSSGKIYRHLISGVLGSSAPEPLQKNTKSQKVFFDGKDDAGQYVKDISGVSARVSLGLSPVFDQTFFDYPKRRHSTDRQLLDPIKEGVVVYDGGNGLDFIKLYSHSGDYIKTIYPFPGDKLNEIKGIKWKDKPDGSGKFPVKTNFLQTSFLETGSLFAMAGKLPTNYNWSHFGMYGKSATFLASSNKMVAFGMGYMARLGLDGTSDGTNFMGPAVGYKIKNKDGEMLVQPSSAAFSPDGKKIYFTGYHYCNYGKASADIITSVDWVSHHHVYEMNIESDEPPNIFLGEPDTLGDDESHFNMPIHIYVDDENRVFVCDYLNNRVQVFNKDKKLLKTINIKYPAFITVLPKSKDVIVITHLIPNKVFNLKPPPITPILYYNLGNFEKMAVGKPIELPKEYTQVAGGYTYGGSGFGYGFCVTDISGDSKIWISHEKPVENVNTRKRGFDSSNIKIWKLSDKKFELLRDFEEEIEKDLPFTKPIHYSRVRLQVNPVTGDLYTTKTIHGFVGKSFDELYKINTKSGKISMVKLPFDAEDFCFDNNGFIYLKSLDVIGRYHSETFKEVPWDYGIEIKTSTSSSSDRVIGDIVSGLKVPTIETWHQGGIYVNVKGSILVSGPYSKSNDAYEQFVPTVYPGRPGFSKINNLLFIFDKYGKLVKSDVVPGLKDNYGVGLDQYNNMYLMNGSTRVIDGKKFPNDWTGTVMKFPFSGGKLISKGETPIPLPVESEPKRQYDVEGLWVEDASWFFGGVGFMGKNSSKGLASGTGCACWNSRMAFDYLNRTFAPELERYSVAILDSNGNLITRVGRYGNRDSMGPKSLKPVGGDEITMIHGAYLSTLTDKFLYIADIGNDRIISVKLKYAIDEIINFPKK